MSSLTFITGFELSTRGKKKSVVCINCGKTVQGYSPLNLCGDCRGFKHQFRLSQTLANAYEPLPESLDVPEISVNALVDWVENVSETS